MYRFFGSSAAPGNTHTESGLLSSAISFQEEALEEPSQEVASAFRALASWGARSQAAVLGTYFLFFLLPRFTFFFAFEGLSISDFILLGIFIMCFPCSIATSALSCF